ncbi:MAG: hypothetical protein MUC68_10615 [Burkholderiaceae bacterium]|nr:hypothetical protein [Burkholderiaceae bacterium]
MIRSLTRRRLLLAGLAGGALLGTGCAVRVRTTNPDGTPFDDARRSDAAQLRIARDGYALVDADWTDAARGRAVPVRLYLPLTGDGPRPLVLFSHGLGGSRRGYSYLGSHFARHGVASLHVQHVGSDRALWGGSPLELATRAWPTCASRSIACWRCRPTIRCTCRSTAAASSPPATRTAPTRRC